MSQPSLEVGTNIRLARQQRGWSLSDVADRTGMSVATLSRIETSKQSIDVALLVTLARVLGVSAARLLGDDDGQDMDVLAERVAALSGSDRARLLQTASRHRRDGDMAAVVSDLLSTLDVMREELEHVARSSRKRRK